MTGRGAIGRYMPTSAMVGACVRMHRRRCGFDAVHRGDPVVALQLRTAGLVSRSGALTDAGRALGEAFELQTSSSTGGRR